MGLILCSQEPVKRPFYIENLGLHIYSSQELCYVIFQYPLIAMDNFIGESLIGFIKSELGMGLLALKLERRISHGEDIEDLLLMILQECDYYSVREISQFQKKVSVLLAMNPADYAKVKADDLSDRKQYGKAIVQYQLLLNNQGENFQRPKWRGEVWNNLGVIYTRLFQFEKGLEAFCHAYDYLSDVNILKQIFVTTLLQKDLVLDEKYQEMISEEQRIEWEQEVSQLKTEVQESEEWRELEETFHRDSIQRRTQTEQMLEKWKENYRHMV